MTIYLVVKYIYIVFKHIRRKKDLLTQNRTRIPILRYQICVFAAYEFGNMFHVV